MRSQLQNWKGGDWDGWDFKGLREALRLGVRTGVRKLKRVSHNVGLLVEMGL